MNKRNRIILVVLFLLIISFAFFYVLSGASRNTAPSTPVPSNSPVITYTPIPTMVTQVPPTSSPNVIITNQFMNLSLKYVSTGISYPEVSGKLDKNVIDKINSALIYYANSAKANAIKMENTAKEQISSSGNTGSGPEFEQTFDFDVKLNNNKLLSLVLNNNSFDGGAHGLSEKIGVSYDLSLGNKLELTDVFTKGYDYISAISDEIKRQLKSKGIESNFGEFTKIKSNQGFYLTPDGLVVIFSEYEYGPYSSGIGEFSVPYSIFGINYIYKG